MFTFGPIQPPHRATAAGIVKQAVIVLLAVVVCRLISVYCIYFIQSEEQSLARTYSCRRTRFVDCVSNPGRSFSVNPFFWSWRLLSRFVVSIVCKDMCIYQKIINYYLTGIIYSSEMHFLLHL